MKRLRLRAWSALIRPGCPVFVQINRKRHRMDGWTYWVAFDFYHPHRAFPGWRWGVVIAWGDVPPDWFDQT